MKLLNVEVEDSLGIFIEPFINIEQSILNMWQSRLVFNEDRNSFKLKLVANEDLCCPIDFEVDILDNTGRAKLSLELDGYTDILEVGYDSVFSEYAETPYILGILSNPITIERYLLKGLEEKARVQYYETLDGNSYRRTVRFGLFGISHLLTKSKYDIEKKDYKPWLNEL